jgi:DNA-binding XRE family transcriptional regulator
MAQEKDYDALLERISKNIKKLRNDPGLTQENMIDYGFNYRHYQRLESGTYSPSLSTLHKCAKVFEVRIADLLK